MPARRAIGKLRHRVEIFEPARQPDDMGGFSRGDAKVIEIWGEMVPMKTYERMEYAKLQQVRSHRCQIRAREDVKQGWFLIYDGRYFYIEGVENIREDQKFQDLILREGGPV